MQVLKPFCCTQEEFFIGFLMMINDRYIAYKRDNTTKRLKTYIRYAQSLLDNGGVYG